MDYINKALLLATKAHEGQIDLDGKPYILHPLAVGLKGKNDAEIIVGFLHDVIEDTTITAHGLRAQGFPSHIVDTLVLLTHDKNDSYEDYLRRIVESGNDTAIAVKINDLTHNLERNAPDSNGVVPHPQQRRKHLAALAYIKDTL